MLRYLLDEHVPPVIVSQIQIKRPEIRVTCLRDWMDGDLRGKDDDAVLYAAIARSFTLVTYDLRTIRGLLKSWAESGISHGGVIFVDEATIAQNDVGGLVTALMSFWDGHHDLDWRDRSMFLPRAPER